MPRLNSKTAWSQQTEFDKTRLLAEFQSLVDNWNGVDSGTLFWNNGKFINSAIAPNIMASVKDFGAKGDNVADDTNAIQTAMNSVGTSGDGALFFPSGTYKISATLTTSIGSNLIGTYTPGFSIGTTINQTAAVPVITLINQNSTTIEQQRIGIRGFNLTGGSNSIYAQNGGVGVTIRDVICNLPTNAGFLMRGFCQEWFVENCEFAGGAYGIFMSFTGLKTDGVTLGTPILFDKSHWYSTYFHGQSVNGIYVALSSGTGDTNTFTDLRIITSGQDAAVFRGSLRCITILGSSMENNGTASPTQASTTATTTAGSANVTVASGTHIVNGQTLTIAGAGTSGADWYPVVSSGGGTTNLVMTTTAPLTVTAADCTNALYSDFVVSGGAFAATTNVTFINLLTTTGTTRYAIDAGGAAGIVAINAYNGRPIYDPTGVVSFLGTGFSTVRPTADVAGSYIESVVGPINVTTTVWTDLTSIVVTPGIWAITGVFTTGSSGALVCTIVDFGISTTSGNSSTGLVQGSNFIELAPNTTTYDVGASIADWKLSVSVPTTVYLKGKATFSAGTEKIGGRLSAIKFSN